METPANPEDEAERLLALQQCAVLDTAPEERFDRLTRLAQTLFGTQMALVSLVDADRQWFKSSQGLDARETPRSISFCGHAILGKDIFEVPDALQDARFADNPLVAGPPYIRFYAGAPLKTTTGYRVGTLCIIDGTPRTLTPKERLILQQIADCVEEELLKIHLVQQGEKLQQANLLGEIIARAQSKFIGSSDRSQVFSGLLDDLLELTGSEYGFIGEILHTQTGAPYLKTYAISDIAWDDTSRAFYDANAPQGLEFFRLDTLFGAALSTGKPVLSNNTALDPRSGGLPEGHPRLDTFLGLPVHFGNEPVALIGLANRPGGYHPALLEFLRPLTATLGQLVAADRSRHQLRASEQRLRSIIDGTRIGTWEWNVQTGATVFNERWAEIVGYTLNELAPITIQTWLDLAHPDDLKASGELLEKHFRHELDYYDCTSRMRHRDGHWVWVHDRGRVVTWTTDGKPLLMSGTHADITEQATTRQALEQQEAHLRNLLGNLPGTVYRCANDANWTMHFISDYIEILSGYPAREFLPAQGGTRTFASLIHSDDAQMVNDSVQADLRNQRGFGVEYRILHADGEYRWVQELGRGVFDAAGQLQYLDGFIWDVTEKKRLEQIKNEFISTVSHELRTPLTSITAALGLVASGALDSMPDRAKEMIGLAQRNGQRLARLINDLLDMEKLGAGKMQFESYPQLLRPIVEEALEANRVYGSERNVQLRLTCQEDGLQVNVDSQRLMQVMSNLLSNAIKYSPASGQVDIHITSDNHCARVAVVDHGPGVPAAFQGRIFEKFAQADASDSRTRGGTGLGLAITRELVEHLGGRMGFHSEEGRGSTFHFELPLAT